ncbi:DedA family protein [Spirosoma sp. KNUC1025]|uniref:DedA family protein n=1 Tax=Spirosoma sp. KNUC1025 TaxID=2894082 RepID=UPI00386F25A3|nr:DedA family protein [Spirosoma sp. KNUC1025]
MTFQELMLTYGYPMLFLGVLLESEAFLLVGVYLAHRGYFSLPMVIALAALSSFVITQVCFFLGHRYGRTFLTKRPHWQPRYNRIERLMNRYGSGLVLGFRALYGLRGAIPAAIGLSSFPTIRFAVYNALGAIGWALIVAFAGNHLAQVGEDVYAFLAQHQRPVLVAIAGLSGLWCVYQLTIHSKLKEPVEL